MSAALHQIAVIFIGILAGFVCRKGKVLSEEGTATVSNIVVKIILPFYLFSAILNSGSAGLWRSSSFRCSGRRQETEASICLKPCAAT